MPQPSSFAEDAGLWPEIEAAIAPHAQAIEAALGFAATTLAPVTDTGSLEAANQFSREAATVARELENARKGATAPVLAQKAMADAYFKAPLDALAAARSKANIQMQNYQDKLRREREAAEEKARQDAAKERRRKEALAAKAVERGDEQRAMEHLEAAARVVEAPVAAPAPPKLAGTFNRVTWHAEVTDASKLPREYLMPDEKKLDRVATALQADFNIPGARAVSSATTVNRSLQ